MNILAAHSGVTFLLFHDFCVLPLIMFEQLLVHMGMLVWIAYLIVSHAQHYEFVEREERWSKGILPGIHFARFIGQKHKKDHFNY